MPSGSFNFDKRDLEELVKPHLKKIGSDTQRQLDSLTRSHAGKPTSEVKAALRSTARRNGWTLSEAEVTDWSRAIESGEGIDVKVNYKL
jgi:hypothetical protein